MSEPGIAVLCASNDDAVLQRKPLASPGIHDHELVIQRGYTADWGVLGVAGRTTAGLTGYVLDRGAAWGTPDGLPAAVQTLDELLLVVRRDARVRFDEAMPNRHLFGADICMQAHDLGPAVLAIDAYCHHNSTLGADLPPEFGAGVEYMREKWQHRLPIYTTCTLTA